MTYSPPETGVPPSGPPLAPHRGTLILVFGILGIVLGFCCVGVVFGILAWVFAAGDLRKMNQGIMNPEGRSATNAGLIMGIISVALVSLLLIVGLVRGASGDKPFNFLGTSPSRKSSIEEMALPKMLDPEEKRSGADRIFGVGEVAPLKDHAVSVVKVEKGFKSNNPFVKPQSSANEFIVVGVAIVNTSDKDLLENQFGFELEDENGIKRTPDLFMDLNSPLESATLAPGGKTAGYIGFEAKKGSKVLKLHYKGNMFTDKEIVIDLLK